MLDLAYPLARNADKLDLILQHLEKKQLVVVEPLYSSPWYSKRKTPHDEAVDKDEAKSMASC